MALLPGTKLAPYEIGAPLGAGGMGAVYRAVDTRLEREAKTISSLNHPHICVLHDVGSQDLISYLVMKRVEGETLAKRLEKATEQVLKYGMQIADAVDKAHRSGVLHREIAKSSRCPSC